MQAARLREHGWKFKGNVRAGRYRWYERKGVGANALGRTWSLMHSVEQECGMRTPRVGVGIGRQERNSKQPNYGINNTRGAATIENQPSGVVDNKEVELGRVGINERERTRSCRHSGPIHDGRAVCGIQSPGETVNLRATV